MGFLLILLLACAAFAQTPAPEGGTTVFRTGVSDVRVDAQVTEGKRVLPGLTQYDFAVEDNGQSQKIVYFGHDSEPLDLLLLLDVSGSMHKYLELVAGTAREALRFLKPQDRVAVMLFSRLTDLRSQLTQDRDQTVKAINDSTLDHELGSGTFINASVLDAADYLKKQTGRGGRRAILIVTDNLSMSFRIPDDAVIRALYESDTVFNGIVIGRGIRPAKPKPGGDLNQDYTPADVFLLADKTGGEAVKGDRAEAAFREMIERIRLRYSLHYHAPKAESGTFRAVRVSLSAAARARYPHAELRARNGYYAQ